MTYHTHGSVYGVEIPAALGAGFAMAACQFAYATARFGVSYRGLAAAHGLVLAVAMYWSLTEELS
jgi:hypothetical protein